MKWKAAGIVALILALFALWLLMRGDPAPVPPAAAAPRAVAAAAAPEPEPDAALDRAPAAPPAAPEVAAEPALLIRFRDWLSSEAIVPRAVVVLAADGTSPIVNPASDGSFRFPQDQPLVLAAAFEAHLPLLAIVRDAPQNEEIAVHAFSAARVTVAFEGLDLSQLPADASISFTADGSRRGGGRPEHGQFMRLSQRFTPWARQVGDPDLSRAAADWFSPEQVRAWRTGALRFLDAEESSPVAAMPLAAFTERHAVTGSAITLEYAPVGFVLSWRTGLSLVQLAPSSAEAAGTLKSETGERYGKFEVPAGDSTLQLAWAAAGAIIGRLPLDGLAGGMMPPVLTLSRIVHDEHSPVNGSHWNPVAGQMDATNGSFLFDDLTPGKYQIDAAWSVGTEVHVSAVRVQLAAGEHRDVGLLAARRGTPMELDLRMLDAFGNVLLPESTFLDPARARVVVNVSDRAEDPLEPSVWLDLDLPLGSPVRVLGLREGYVWAHAGLRSRYTAKDLQPSITFLRFDPDGDRITLPTENRVEIVARFQAGAVPLTLRFELPDDAWDRRYNLHVTHQASGTAVPCADWEAEKDVRRRKSEHSIQLAPGIYRLFVVSNTSSMAKPGEVHHFAARTLIVERAGQVESVSLVPGLEAAGVADLPAMQDSSSALFFDVVSIGGTEEPSKAWFTARVDAQNVFRLHGLPPDAVLFNQDSRTLWTVNATGQLVRLP